MDPRSREVPVDLFPFLSILACTMGSLMLITLSFTGGKASNVPEVLLVPHQVKNVPHLLIWDGSTVAVDSEDGQVRVPWARASENGGDNDTPFGEVLRAVKENKDTHYFFIAVRPSGFDSFNDGPKKLIIDAGLRYGHWPIAQNKSLSMRFKGDKPEEVDGSA